MNRLVVLPSCGKKEKAMRTIALCTLGVLALALPAAAQAPEKAHATIMDAKGQQIGRATLTETSGGVLIDLEISGLSSGEHGFHIHQTGKCEPNTNFESASGHFALGGQKHGYFSDGDPHAGDMPNQFVGQDGKLRVQVVNPNVTLEDGEGGLFDQDGSAIVVHANADDYRSQPSGQSGARIACGVIEKG
jgi:Cu-Zn family superoxide dismutase